MAWFFDIYIPTASSWYELKYEEQREFQEKNKWLESIKLAVNTEKTKYMVFRSYSTGAPKLGIFEIDSEIVNDICLLG